jgi:plastocyanin
MRALGLALAAAVLACTAAGEAARLRPAATAWQAPRQAKPKPATVKITIEGMKYSPANPTVHVGDTIVWTNTDIVAHTVTSKTGAFDSNLIAPGGTWKYVAKKAGEFDYKCNYHQPMTGKFTVR